MTRLMNLQIGYQRSSLAVLSRPPLSRDAIKCYDKIDSSATKVETLIRYLQTWGYLETRIKETVKKDAEQFQNFVPNIPGLSMTSEDLLDFLHQLADADIISYSERTHPYDSNEYIVEYSARVNRRSWTSSLPQG